MIPLDVRAIAEKMAAARGIPPAHLLAMIQVESGGQVFTTVDGHQVPLVLYEPHLAWRATTEPVRGQLAARGLAAPKRNKKLYGKTQTARWAQIKTASDIAGRTVAYGSASFGVGQVLGQNWKMLGYASLDEFLNTVISGAEGQIEAMLRYVEHAGILDDLVAGRWPTVFRIYNGPKWKAGGYGRKIAAALALYGGSRAQPDGMLRAGSKGARVRELQALLARAGYQVKVDGDFGPSTRDALKAFQSANGLTADGIYGPQTEGLLGTMRQGPQDKPGQLKPQENPDVVGGVLAGTGGPIVITEAKNAVDAATEQLQQVTGFGQVIDALLAGLSVLAVVLALAGIGFAAWSWWQSRQTREV